MRRHFVIHIVSSPFTNVKKIFYFFILYSIFFFNNFNLRHDSLRYRDIFHFFILWKIFILWFQHLLINLSWISYCIGNLLTLSERNISCFLLGYRFKEGEESGNSEAVDSIRGSALPCIFDSTPVFLFSALSACLCSRIPGSHFHIFSRVSRHPFWFISYLRQWALTFVFFSPLFYYLSLYVKTHHEPSWVFRHPISHSPSLGFCLSLFRLSLEWNFRRDWRERMYLVSCFVILCFQF